MIQIEGLTLPCILCGNLAPVVAERPPQILRAGALTLRTIECTHCQITIETT